LQIIPTPDGLITLAQAAALTGRSEKTVWAWTKTGYKAPDGTRVKVTVKRRDGWLILVDPVEIARADIATDPKRRYRGFPLPAVA
jgi:predicted DNA-binding transcriptional regulator AlpA